MIDRDEARRHLEDSMRSAPAIKPLCTEVHADMLFDKLRAAGLGPLMAARGDSADPTVVVEQSTDMVRRIMSGDPNWITPANYEPVICSVVQLMKNGMAVGCTPMSCIICQLNTWRTEDGRCRCPDPACTYREPGDVPPFESWLDRVVQDQLDWVRDAGMVLDA